MVLQIAIVGAGPAGLLLARLLTINPNASELYKITIFESDTSPNARKQGGTLDLHPSTGLLAIKRAGLHNEFLEHARYDSTALLVCDKRGVGYVKMPASEIGSPEIDRTVLRELLLGSLDKRTVVWGKKSIGVQKQDGDQEKFELSFDDGDCRSGFDLVVGADGAWSKVRTSFLDQETLPIYSCLMGYEFSIPDAEAEAKQEWKLVNRGNLFAFGDSKGLIAQQLGDGSLDINCWIVDEVDEPAQSRDNHGAVDKKKCKAEVLAKYDDWSPELRALIEKAEIESVQPRYLYRLPEGYKWNHETGVTLLGDAAHLLLPFGGEGVNIAFEDAMKLSDAITDACQPEIQFSSSLRDILDQRIRDFEVNMFYRAKRAQKMSNRMTEAMMYRKDAPRAGIESWLLSRIEYDFPLASRVLYPLLLASIYGSYFVYKRFV